VIPLPLDEVEELCPGRLVRAGWPSEADPDLLWLKPHVARLRRKVESAGGPKILAVRGVGYRLES